jgi:TetR/AcrR family transcriptional regulator, repressor for neighboring sulfatase
VKSRRSASKRRSPEAPLTEPSLASASAAPRTRRSAGEARRRILEAAEAQLMKVGPEGLRLTDLAKTLRVSHPAILHHFGSREGLVAAVVRHSMQALSAQLLAALRAGNQSADRAKLIEMVAEVCDERGLARLIAWLMLSGRASKLPRTTDLPLKQLAEAAHVLRRQHSQTASYDDTLFILQLVATVLLGDAIFGEAVRAASGIENSAQAAHEFRVRLSRLLPL